MNDICRNYCEKAIYYQKKCLFILEPWRLQITLKASERTDQLNATQISDINGHLSAITDELGSVNLKMRNYEIAGTYFDQSLAYSKGIIDSAYDINGKRIEDGKERRKAARYYVTLNNKGKNLYFQLKYNAAKVVFEEAYNIMAEQHDPSHPDTLDAALRLIDVLIHTNDFYDGERYECVMIFLHTLSTLKMKVHIYIYTYICIYLYMFLHIYIYIYRCGQTSLLFSTSKLPVTQAKQCKKARRIY
jgi:tetratricopeptide (TPR) repeat protein